MVAFCLGGMARNDSEKKLHFLLFLESKSFEREILMLIFKLLGTTTVWHF